MSAPDVLADINGIARRVHFGPNSDITQLARTNRICKLLPNGPNLEQN